MSTIITIIAIILLAYWLRKLYEEEWLPRRPENQILELEKWADEDREFALQDSLNLGKEQVKYVLDKTEAEYTRLKERFRHDEKKRLELAKDWREYTDAVREVSWAGDGLDVDWENDAHDRYRESVKEPHVKMEEIEKRFQEMLGEKFVDRWGEYAEKYMKSDFATSPSRRKGKNR